MGNSPGDQVGKSHEDDAGGTPSWSNTTPANQASNFQKMVCTMNTLTCVKPDTTSRNYMEWVQFAKGLGLRLPTKDELKAYLTAGGT